MSGTRLQTPLELVVGGAIAGAVVTTTLNAGSLASLAGPADPMRFLFLGLFGVLAVAYVALTRPHLRVSLAVAVPLVLLETLALASAVWSIGPRRTVEQALALGTILVAAGIVAAAARDRPSLARRALLGAVVGAGIVAAGGFVLWIVDPTVATFVFDRPALQRFRGLGANANTVPLLGATTLPAALWLGTCAAGWTRAVAAVSALGLGVTIVESGSRAAAAAAVVGTLVTAVLLRAQRRRRVALVVAAAALATGALLGGAERTAAPATAPPAAAVLVADGSLATPPSQPPGWPGPLYKQVGGGGSANAFSSGREQAWRGAIEQGWNRGIAGFGFANESPAFIDRYSGFQGVYVENSYLGTFLQLGLVGACILALTVAAAARAGARTIGEGDARIRNLGAAAAGGATAALVVSVVQSFLLAPGSVGALPAWLGLLVAAFAATPGSRPIPRRWALPAAAAAVAFVAAAVVAGRAQAAHDTDAQRRGIEDVYRAAGGKVGGPTLTAFSLTTLYDCFYHRSGHVPYALQTCYDHDGRLVDAIDRRNGRTRFWSLRYDPQASPIRVAPSEVRAVLERSGALDYARLYLGGYPTWGLVDTPPVLITPWLRRLGRPAPPAGRDTA